MTQEDFKSWLGHVAIMVLLFLFSLVIAAVFSCCKTIVPCVSHDSDSVRVDVRVDTFYRHTRDSVRIQLPCSDTIEVAYMERWHTDTIYKVREAHDTINVCKVDSIPYAVEVVKPERYVPGFARFCMWFFAFVCLALIIYIVVRVLRVYTRV